MEDKRIYYVGIDHGNHLMKSANHVFENGVERLATKPTFSGNTRLSSAGTGGCLLQWYIRNRNSR